MRAITTKLLACFLVCCLYSSIAQAQWVELPRSTTNALFTALEVDQRNGTLYSAHTDGLLKVRMLNADGEWENLGAAEGVSPGNASWASLAVDADGVLYAAFTDDAEGAGSKASVMKYDVASAAWEYVGQVHLSEAGTRHTQIVIDNNNVPHVAFRDIAAPAGDVKVLKYDAAEELWVDVLTGSSTEFTSISSGSAAFTSIAFGEDNTLYVAYQDLAASDKATVKKLEPGQSSFTVVGSEKFTETTAEHIAIAVDNDDKVYITYGVKNLPVYVKMFDSDPQVNSWVNVGSTATPFELPFYHNYSQGEIRTDLFIDNSNQPVVAYLANSWRGLMYRFDGNAWTAIGGIDNLPDHHRWPSYALDKADNKYYVSGRGGGGTENGRNIVRVYECGPVAETAPVTSEVNEGEDATFTASATGTNITYQWQVNTLDGSGFNDVADGENYSGATTGTLTVIGATVPMNGYEYRAVATSDCGSKAMESAVLRVIPPASVWTGGPISEGRGFWTSMDVDSEGTLYILSDESAYKVFKKVNGEWVQVGDAFTGSIADNRYIFPTLKVDQNDVPFVAYQNHEDGDKLYVRKWNSTTETWDIVGDPTPEGVRYTYINFDNNNVPYVFYRSLESGNFHYKVIKFVDGAWQQVGPAVGGPTGNNTLNITFDSNNDPYVVYQDGSATNSIFVKKYNETADTWDEIGAVGQGSNPYMALDIEGTPYVVYNDATLNKALVKMFDGTSWVVVGQADGFSEGGVSSDDGTTKIFFGADNRPYVAFKDGSGKFFVLNGTSWELVGGTNANVGGTGWHNSTMDKENGILYFSYRNSSDAGRRVFVYEFRVGPPVSASPQDKEVIEGEGTTLTAIAAGSNLSYQWQVDEGGNGWFANIPESSDNYSGTNTTSLEINPSTMGMNENQYRMVAIGEWGASTTDAATLTVISSNTCFAPVVSTQPADVESCPGTNARFTVGLSEGSEPQYQWQVSGDGTSFTDVVNGGVYSGANTATLTLTGLTNELDGNLYRVVVTTGCSDAEAISASAALNVFDAPTIVTQPVDPGTVCPGTLTTLSVEGIGENLTYIWQVSVDGGDFVDITDEEVYEGITSNALAITSPTPEMSGNTYRVVASGTCQPVFRGNISSSVTLNVYQPLNAGAISGKQSICYNTIPAPLTNSVLASGSNNTTASNYVYQWQQSPDNANWSNIDNATEVSYAPAALAQTTYFRRMVTNTGCAIPAVDYSESVKVIVFNDISAGEVVWTGEGDVMKGSNAAPIESSTDATGGNIVAYQWEYSTDGSTFTPIPGATGKDFAPASVMETREYRRVATSENGCGSVISNTVSIAVRENGFELSMIPNAILPNSNSQLNKTWGVKNMHYSGNVSIRVFDVKGNTIFSTENPSQEWDGTYNGELVPAGVYYFSIENGDQKFNGPLKVIY